MIFPVLTTLIWAGLSWYLGKKNRLDFTPSGLRVIASESAAAPFSGNNPVFFVWFLLFLILPLFWGLSFWLRSDLNVIVVIITLIWAYNWTKYVFEL